LYHRHKLCKTSSLGVYMCSSQSVKQKVDLAEHSDLLIDTDNV